MWHDRRGGDEKFNPRRRLRATQVERVRLQQLDPGAPAHRGHLDGHGVDRVPECGVYRGLEGE